MIQNPENRPDFFGRTVCPLGIALALVVTCASTGCERDARPVSESDQQRAQVTLFNATHDVLPLRRQTLHSNYVVSCGLVAYEPSRFLSEAHLSTPTYSELLSGVEEPLIPMREGSEVSADTSSACRFSFVGTEDDRLSPIATTWPRDLPEKSFYYDVDAPADVEPQPPALMAEPLYDNVDPSELPAWRNRPCGGDLDTCSDEEYMDALTAPTGARYEWNGIGTFPVLSSWRPSALSEMPVRDSDEACYTGRDATPLMWDEPPSDVWRVDAVTTVFEDPPESNDDATENTEQEPRSDWVCHDVELTQSTSEQTWSFCGSRRIAQRLASRYKRGDVFVEFFTESQSGSPPSAYEALTIEIDRRTDEGETFETESIEAIQGYGIPEHIGLNWSTTHRNECDPRREVADCDQVVLPTDLYLHLSGETLRIVPGEAHFLAPDIHQRIEYVRGLYRVVADLRCQDERTGPDHLSHPGAYLEVVYYGGVTEVSEQ